MLNNKALQLLGLATRAGKTMAGEFLVEKAIKQKKAFLVLVAEDASDNTKKLFNDKTTYYDIPCFVVATKDELGKAVGKKQRASVAVLDEGFASSIIDLLA